MTAPRSARRILGSLLFVLAVVLPLFRQSGARSWETVWAEDGAVYYPEAAHEGGLAVLLRGYAGYLQLPPRVLGALATFVPVRNLPIWFALSTTLVTALLAWFIYWATEGWITSTAVRLALATLVVLMPAAGRENTANITNVIWVFAAVGPWALLSRREGGRDAALRSTVAAVAAMSTALSLTFLPLAWGYASVRRSRATLLTAGAFSAGLAVQAWVTFTGVQRLRLPSSLPQLIDLVSVRVFGMFLIGNTGIAALWVRHGRLVVVGAPIVAALLLILLFRGAGRGPQILGLTLVAYALISFVVPVWARGTMVVPLPANVDYIEIQSRYDVIPEIMLASAVAILIAPSNPGRNRWIARAGRPLFVMHVIVLVWLGFSVTSVRSHGPSWSSALRAAFVAHCVGAPADKEVLVRTNRYGAWSAPLTCGAVASAQ